MRIAAVKISLIVPLLLVGCAAAPEPVRTAKMESRLGELLRGKVAGATRSCIPLRSATRQTIIDERTILYRVNANRVYRSDLDPGCPGLDDRSTLIHRTTSNNLCSGEIFEYRDAGTQFARGSCTFGPFTEYRTAKR